MHTNRDILKKKSCRIVGNQEASKIKVCSFIAFAKNCSDLSKCSPIIRKNTADFQECRWQGRWRCGVAAVINFRALNNKKELMIFFERQYI
jgi:hypothetical protein